MGKPSSSQVSKPSNHSMQSNNSKTKMNHPMKSKKSRIKKNRRLRNNRIKKLFENLRNESSVSDTSISLNSTHEVTVIPSTSNKRKMSCLEVIDDKNLIINGSPIVINDDSILNDDSLTIPQKRSKLTCSTPNKSSVVQEFCEISNNNNVNDNMNSEIINFTKQINDDSYLTIDLTGESFNTAKDNSNPIEIIKDTDPDCRFVSVESDSSLSCASDVTVLRKSSKQLRTFKQGIAKMNSSDKGKLLEFIMQNIFVGCSLPEPKKKSLGNIKDSTECATETVDLVESPRDLYIKEVIVGQVGKRSSRNSVGSNIYDPDRNHPKTGLRMVVIDGSNVAMETVRDPKIFGAQANLICTMVLPAGQRTRLWHCLALKVESSFIEEGFRLYNITLRPIGAKHQRKMLYSKGKEFSVKGLKICIDYFLRRGHVVKAFVPRFRCKFGKSSDPRLLDQLERQGLVTYTPSREIRGRCITSYDDRYIIQTAAEFDGVIVSGDNYRDLINENPRWRFVIENRLLPFTWVNDMIMFPKDPLGRYGPTLEQFLKHPPEASSSNNVQIIS